MIRKELKTCFDPLILSFPRKGKESPGYLAGFLRHENNASRFYTKSGVSGRSHSATACKASCQLDSIRTWTRSSLPRP